MPAYAASAPGKIILFGEHAVVYGRPAIAAPVFQVQAKAVVTPDPRGAPGQVRIQAPGIGLKTTLEQLPDENPIAFTLTLLCQHLGITHLPALSLAVTSTIPVASGLGSGAAVTVAILRALSAFLGRPLDSADVSALAYEVEKLHHGTPSGIDNTVIARAMPVFFVRDQPIQTFTVPVPFQIVIAGTGVRSPTRQAVAEVRRRWQADPARFELLFDRIASLTLQARQLIETGRPLELGPLMDENQALLAECGVSSPELDELIAAARAAGALGVKLSGGGQGGNLIALAPSNRVPSLIEHLKSAGAHSAFVTEIRS